MQRKRTCPETCSGTERRCRSQKRQARTTLAETADGEFVAVALASGSAAAGGEKEERMRERCAPSFHQRREAEPAAAAAEKKTLRTWRGASAAAAAADEMRMQRRRKRAGPTFHNQHMSCTTGRPGCPTMAFVEREIHTMWPERLASGMEEDEDDKAETAGVEKDNEAAGAGCRCCCCWCWGESAEARGARGNGDGAEEDGESACKVARDEYERCVYNKRGK